MLAFLLVMVSASGAFAQAAIDFGRYHALVIGNNDYRHIPKLRTAVNDARAIADVLKGKYDFKVELLVNADRDTMIQAINRYRGLGDRDNLVIYYAGHGVLDEASDRGFWLPVDAEKGNEARWIDVATISGNLRAMNARHILVIADSCYSGTLTRAAPASLAQNGNRDAWLARMRERRARMALVSGGLEPVLDGGGGGNSVFARAVINTLRENEGVLQGGELFNQLRGRVVANADQTPAYNDIRYAGHEGGDFIFVPRGGARALSAPPAAAGPAAAPASADQMELAFWDAIK
ncbi:caspase family protein, partial [Desertibaculum subflavum]|uniref:caspase family protein n=1 Tax=Desertibaculum subflavum TaxID=2268458 RepID=UPI0013C501B1